MEKEKTPPTNKYFFEWREELEKFLRKKGIPHSVSDADVICINLEGWNEEPLLKLITEYNKWKDLRELHRAAYLSSFERSFDEVWEKYSGGSNSKT